MNDPIKREDTVEDHIQINKVIYMQNFIALAKLVIIYLTVSYYAGLLWYIYVDNSQKYWLQNF